MIRHPPRSPLFPYPTLFQSNYTPTIEPFLPNPQLQVGGQQIMAVQYYSFNPTFDENTYTNLMWQTLDRHEDRKSTRLNSRHSQISYAVFCLKKKKISQDTRT